MRFLLTGLLWLTLAVSPALAQNQPTTGQEVEKPESSGSALPWAVGLIFTLAILLIVCMPSRKSQN